MTCHSCALFILSLLTFSLLFLKHLLTAKGFDYFICLFRGNRNDFIVIFDDLFFDILEDSVDFSVLVESNDSTACVSSCFLIDIDSNVFDRSILIEDSAKVHVG